MNFTPELSTNAAILTTLLAAVLWGSWLISVKFLGEYPLDAFVVTLAATTMVAAWTAGITLDGGALFRNIGDVWAADPRRVPAVLLGGAVYVNGIRLTLLVLQSIGVTIAQPIGSSISILVGTLISALIGGVPEGVSLGWILLACVVLVSAVLVAVLAGQLRSRSGAASAKVVVATSADTPVIWRSVGLLIIASMLVPAYPLTLSYALSTPTHPEGFAVLPYMVLLSIGAFSGSMLTSGTLLLHRRQWSCVFSAPLRVHKFGLASGLSHYGGNLLQAFGTASLSSVISWPLAMSAGLWSLMWGLLYGEFKGAPPRAYAALSSSVALFILGVYIVTRTL